MVVVVIIAISAAMVIPLATRQLRDNQVHRIAKEVASTYRNARMLAMARGGAVVVEMRNVGGVKVLEGRNPTKTNACQYLPVAHCNRAGGTLNPWTDPNKTELVEQLASPSGISIRIADGSTQPLTHVCYTPMGSTMRMNTAVGFVPMRTALPLDIYRHRPGSPDTPVGLVRKVAVLPNGSARVTTAELR